MCYCLLCCVCFMCSASMCDKDGKEDVVTKQKVRLVNGCGEKIYVASSFLSYSFVKPSDFLMLDGLDGLIAVDHGGEYVVSIDLKIKGSHTDMNSKVCQFLIFKEGTIESHSVQELMVDNIYDKRLVYTFAELKRNGYRIVYTGE